MFDVWLNDAKMSGVSTFLKIHTIPTKSITSLSLIRFEFINGLLMATFEFRMAFPSVPQSLVDLMNVEFFCFFFKVPSSTEN